MYVRKYVVDSFKTALFIGEYLTLTACSTERLDFLVLASDICISSSTEKLDKTPFIEKLIETQTILLPDLQLCIVNVYWPFGDKDLFLTKLSAHVEHLL